MEVRLRLVLGWCLFFVKFQAGGAYSGGAYKKSVYHASSSDQSFSMPIDQMMAHGHQEYTMIPRRPRVKEFSTKIDRKLYHTRSLYQHLAFSTYSRPKIE